MLTHKKGETFTATVRDLASDGRGIVSHPSGLTVFVAGVWPGEDIHVKFIGLRNRVGQGELLELLKPSPFRVTPPCYHHGHSQRFCGGCPWQFIDYLAQLKAKQERVEKAFTILDFLKVQPIIPTSTQLAFRNRAQFKTDGEKLGYLSSQTHYLVDVEQCPILDVHNQQLLKQLRQQLPNPAWRIKSRRRKQKPQWTTLNIDNKTDIDSISVNKRLPFQQSNNQQNQQMQLWLKDQLKSQPPTGSIVEFFCGSGNFTDVIVANTDADIVAVEGDERALAQLAAKQYSNVTIFQADLYGDDGLQTFPTSGKHFFTLILDPPRDGLKNPGDVLKKFKNLSRVIYISCNLATLCRDLDFFCRQGFRIIEVQPIDLAPHTPHIELMVNLVKL